MFAHEPGNALPAHLLFPLEQHPHIDRQFASRGLQQCFQSLHMHVHLTLVVDRSTGIKVSVPLRRLKRGREPFVQRVGRLHIVMPVGQAGRLARGMQPVSIHQRMTGGFNHSNVFQANSLQFPGQALGGESHVAFMLRKRRNGRNTEERLQFLKEPRLLAAGELNCGWHE